MGGWAGFVQVCTGLRYNLASAIIRTIETGKAKRGGAVGKCEVCGEETTPRAKYCGPVCRVKAYRARHKATTPGRACAVCGASIDGLRADAKYCGPNCLARAARARRREWARARGSR